MNIAAPRASRPTWTAVLVRCLHKRMIPSLPRRLRSPVDSSLLGGVSALVTQVVPSAVRALRSRDPGIVDLAIADTCSGFPQIEVEPALRSWASTQGFDILLDRLQDLAEEEIAFEPGVFLLTRERATQLRTEPSPHPPEPEPPMPEPRPGENQLVLDPDHPGASRTTLRITGTIPPETWNRFGSRVLSRLRAGDDLQVSVELEVTADAALAGTIETEVKRAVDELMLDDRLQVEREEVGDGPNREG